jgi:hypothetical protein
MKTEDLIKILEIQRKLKEYEMKITKMAGYLSDYYIDRAIESDDFSSISSFLIDYFSGTLGSSFDVGYLISKYKEFELDKKIEDIDFNLEEWYKLKYEIKQQPILNINEPTMSDEEYIKYLIEEKKKIIED